MIDCQETNQHIEIQAYNIRYHFTILQQINPDVQEEDTILLLPALHYLYSGNYQNPTVDTT
jgi:hypothetical protein